MSWLKKSEPFEKFCAVAFVFLATLSCLATAQSLTLTLGLEILPSWLTFIFAFILVFMLYALTSYLLVQIVNSLNDNYAAEKNIKLPQRRSTFIGSLLGVILLWLVCSMPTNTHSMLHMKVAKEVANAELDIQREVFVGKLDLTDRDIIENFQKDSSDLCSRIDVKRGKFAQEVTHQGRPGLGDSAKVILHEIEILCKEPAGSYFITTGYQNTPPNTIVEIFDREIVKLCKKRVDKLRVDRDNFIMNRAKDREKLNELISNIDNTKSGLEDGTISVKKARKTIDNGYSFNSEYEQEILDKVEILINKEIGHNPRNVQKYVRYRSDRLYSVFNVWGDFFSGKLPKTFDMPYWILWALILDIAAFIFSTIAFRGKTKKTKF